MSAGKMINIVGKWQPYESNSSDLSAMEVTPIYLIAAAEYLLLVSTWSAQDRLIVTFLQFSVINGNAAVVNLLCQLQIHAFFYVKSQ